MSRLELRRHPDGRIIAGRWDPDGERFVGEVVMTEAERTSSVEALLVELRKDPDIYGWVIDWLEARGA
jgi:hypothetical protein